MKCILSLKRLFWMSDFHMIIVCILMPLERERLKVYDLKEIYHIFIQSGFLALQYKNNYICFLKIESILSFCKDSGKMVIHSSLFKACSQFSMKERWGVEKGRSRWEVCHCIKMGNIRNDIEDHVSYHDLNLHWFKLECASKLDGSSVNKDSVSEQISLQ